MLSPRYALFVSPSLSLQAQVEVDDGVSRWCESHGGLVETQVSITNPSLDEIVDGAHQAAAGLA